MKVRGVVVALTALLVLAVAVPASAGTGLNAYKANAKGLKQLRELKKLGFDLTEGKRERASRSSPRRRRSRSCAGQASGPSCSGTARPHRAEGRRRAGGRRLARSGARSRAPTSRCRARRATPPRTSRRRWSTSPRSTPTSPSSRPSATRCNGLPIYAMKVTKNATRRRTAAVPRCSTRRSSTLASGSPARPSGARCACSSTTTASTGTAIGTDGQPVDGVSVEGAHQAGEHPRAVVHPHREPRRLRLHVRPGEPALAQEPARQQRRRADHRRRRRGPEPELPDALELRRRGLEHRHLVRDLPRHGAGLGAGDAGVPVADEQGPLRLQQERPHRGAAAPVAVRLAGGHARRRRAADDGARR